MANTSTSASQATVSGLLGSIVTALLLLLARAAGLILPKMLLDRTVDSPHD
ncbi:MAG: hypothetical protein ACRYGP_11760 [Janthinobacterium lividum]